MWDLNFIQRFLLYYFFFLFLSRLMGAKNINLASIYWFFHSLEKDAWENILIFHSVACEALKKLDVKNVVEKFQVTFMEKFHNSKKTCSWWNIRDNFSDFDFTCFRLFSQYVQIANWTRTLFFRVRFKAIWKLHVSETNFFKDFIVSNSFLFQAMTARISLLRTLLVIVQ